MKSSRESVRGEWGGREKRGGGGGGEGVEKEMWREVRRNEKRRRGGGGWKGRWRGEAKGEGKSKGRWRGRPRGGEVEEQKKFLYYLNFTSTTPKRTRMGTERTIAKQLIFRGEKGGQFHSYTTEASN